ncbi:MAG: hypothetical protein KY468_13645 [Armatimonadetes bacterium]|nr:hypothetical protein [Armatimonadota bacterium]
MAVTAPSYSHDYPEFDPRALRPRNPARPIRNARRAAQTVEHRVRRSHTRHGSLVGSLLHSRLMDDVCAVVVGAAGIFFVLAVARMLLGS